MSLQRVHDYLKKHFDDGYVSSPLDYKYMVRLRLLLSGVGAWPYKQFGHDRLDAILSTYQLFLLLFSVTVAYLSALYMRVHAPEITFFDLGHVILCWLLNFMYFQRLLTSFKQTYKATIKEYILEFHLFFFKSRSPYAAKVHAQIHTLSGMCTVYTIGIMITGICLFTFMPWYNNHSKGMFSKHRPENSTFEHSVYFHLPNEVYTNIKGYYSLFTVNIFVACTTTIGMCVFDLLLSFIVFQIWGHLRILKHNLLSLQQNGDSAMYSVEENEKIRMQLKENILYHNLIINFVDQCSEAFSEYLFVFYLLMQLITCILLLEVSSFTAEALAKYGPVTVAMHQQLIQTSILFEMLNTKSKQLIDAVYATPWERMDAANRKTVLIFLQRVQTPVSLKAAKVVPVGVNTMSKVLKNSFTYYMMLKTLAGHGAVAVLKNSFTYYMMLKTLAGDR